MKQRAFIIFTLYTWGRVLYGLIFHPYKTIREIVRHPVFTPVILTPFMGLLVLFLLGRVGALLLELHDTTRVFVAISLSSCLFAIVFWQVLLIYLLFSLISSRRNE